MPQIIQENSTIHPEEALREANIALEQKVQERTQELERAYDATLEEWAKSLDIRDHGTQGHTQRVTQMTLALAQAMGIGKEEQVPIRRGALLHDIGTIGIPDAVLLKSGKLSDEDLAAIKQHPVHAYEWLSPINYLQPALAIPYCHHERWDGTGYPRGLSGEQIPLAARLFAVVDVWDALGSDRPYRKAWSQDQVRAHIQSLAGTGFDPNVVEVFLDLLMRESSI